MGLTQAQIERQDVVDGVIFEMLNELNPHPEALEWDIELIGEVRDVVQELLIKMGLCTEMEFYPYIEHKVEG